MEYNLRRDNSIIRKNWFGVLMIGILVWCVGMGLLLRLDFGRREADRPFEDRGLPVIDIELSGVSLEEIKGGARETIYDGNRLNLYNGTVINNYEEVEIKGRGNSTWGQPKRPYQVNFANKVDLLGIGKAKKWVLLANYFDASLMRSDVAMLLAEMLGSEYSTRGRFVELYFNGEYEGVYYLLHKIEVAKGSVDLRGQGGVLFEMDSLHRWEEECYESYLDECLVLKDAVAKDLSMREVAAESFMEDFDEFEIAVMDGDYDTVARKIDVESFAKYFLINEFTVNPDAYSSSFYLYKKDFDSKIYAGPIWDFDFALANREWYWQIDERFFSPTESMIRKREALGLDGLKEDHGISKIFYYLMEMPEFKETVSQVFQERLSGRKIEFIRSIESEIEKCYEGIKADEIRWNEAGFEEEAEKMMTWIEKRYDYFEEEYGDMGETRLLRVL